jgi:oligopeptide/dipeptide ABC transporter ATP-binding protein
MSMLLEVESLTVRFPTASGPIAAVDGLSFSVAQGEFLGIVGESGSGKSVTALAVMGLITTPGRIDAGSIRLEGRELVGLPDKAMRHLRGARMAMVFQEPMASLNPVMRVGEQIAEAIRWHEPTSARAAKARAVELLGTVGIPAPAERARAYPQQMSGGMRQRAMIAMALACGPCLLIADEPTTALDVTVQAQIMDLLRTLREKFGMAILLITHDLGLVAEQADRVLVMYAGRLVEEAPTAPLFAAPRHPYTAGLLASIPDIDHRRDELAAIEGVVPSLAALPPGCRFAPRCAYAEPACNDGEPPLRRFGARAHACRRDLALGATT